MTSNSALADELERARDYDDPGLAELHQQAAAALRAAALAPTEADVERAAKAIWEISPRAFGWPGGDTAPEWYHEGEMARAPFIMLARAALAALPCAPWPTGTWQPIETAPKNDGVHFIGLCGGYGATEVVRFSDGSFGLATFNGSIRKAEPTMWQPLPAVPTEKKGETR